jgi:aryl-alcohol dehydrogenase-like predicted oxidoreductase
MRYRNLGDSGIQVSEVCLGTMTFGQQNTRAEAFRLLDHAVAAGVNVLDTAEMYPIPPRAETYGATEEIVGDWLAARGGRENIVVATKIVGPGIAYLNRDGGAFAPRHLKAAIDASLRRLRTDTIDLYQLHWPERSTNMFGQRGYRHGDERPFTPFADVLAALADEIRAGRVRAVGLSNETPWGLATCLRLAGENGLPRVASIQNPYSLLNRLFDVGLAEITERERVGMLAYSPLAFGVLTGKYAAGARPAGARLTLFPHYTRYMKPRAIAATEAYVDLGRRHGLRPAQMALAFVAAQPFVTSVIIGARTQQQVEENLAAFEMALPEDVLAQIAAVHEDNPDPAP